MEPVSFAQGWGAGLAAARSIWRPPGRTMPLAGLYFFFALAAAFVPVVGQLIWALLSTHVSVAAMRLEQLEMGRASGGAPPRLVAACSMVFGRPTLVRLMGLSALSCLTYLLVVVVSLGLVYGVAGAVGARGAGGSPGSTLGALPLAAATLCAFFWAGPAAASIWSMVGWCSVIQKEPDAPVFRRACELARKAGPALLAVYLPSVLFGACSGMLAAAFLYAAASTPGMGWTFGLACFFCSAIGIVGYLALATLAQARGVHLVCRMAMMRLETAPETKIDGASPDSGRAAS